MPGKPRLAAKEWESHGTVNDFQMENQKILVENFDSPESEFSSGKFLTSSTQHFVGLRLSFLFGLVSARKKGVLFLVLKCQQICFRILVKSGQLLVLTHSYWSMYYLRESRVHQLTLVKTTSYPV